MAREKVEAEHQQELASHERSKADEAAREAAAIDEAASGELSKATPALEEARRAVDCLSKPSLVELRSMASPPAIVLVVTKSV